MTGWFLTILKNISQWEGLSQILWKKMFQTTNQMIFTWYDLICLATGWHAMCWPICHFQGEQKHCATWGCNMLLNGAKKHQRTTDEVFWDYWEACLPMTMVSICSWGSPNWYPKTNPCSWAHFKLSWPVSTNWIKLTGHLLTQFNPAIMKIAQLAVASF